MPQEGSKVLLYSWVMIAGVIATALPGSAMAQTTTASRPGSIFGAALDEPSAKTPNISTEELKRALADGRTLLLDNRPYPEFALGHIPGAQNVAPKPGMPMSEYTSDVKEVMRITGGDTRRPVILYCAGPFCGKSKRVADDLIAAGYTNVRRYQLGAPVWRALGGVMALELDGVRQILENDRTAILIDARAPSGVRGTAVAGAVNLSAGEVKKAKDDGRVPMHDHNTRIVVFGAGEADARAVAEELTQNAFHNVSYFAGGIDALKGVLPTSAAIRVVAGASVAPPQAGGLAQETVHESANMVTRILRLAAGAKIAEHHHPSHDETFIVQHGRVRLMLNDVERELREGDVAYIPSGTIISGRNTNAGETVLIVVWAGTGRPGALTVNGRPAHAH